MKMLALALVLSSESAFAQNRARDQLKASAPSSTEIAVPATPSANSADRSVSNANRGSAAAADNDTCLSGVPGAAMFDKVKILFDSGVPATKEELTGWHAGRAVRDNRPDWLYGSVLLAEDFTDASGRTTFRVTDHPNDVQDYFDDLDAAKTTFLRAMWAEVAPTAHEVLFPSAVVVSKVMAFRKARGCVISAFRRAEHGPTPGSEPYLYAYYCKDVTPLDGN